MILMQSCEDNGKACSSLLVKKTLVAYSIKMGRWCDGRCQEVGGEELEECCKE